MRIGLIQELHGTADSAPRWEDIVSRARLAEEAGFDVFVFEDALLYGGVPEGETSGVWESTTIAAALAAATKTIDLGQSVINSPYRSPALLASIVSTLDEISGGRYVFGIGAGNTPDSDYEAFGFPTDRRFSRFAEAIQIIHALLKTGSADFEGDYYSARNSEIVLRGPNDQGPPINIAAGGPRMLGLVARYADAWNWWAYDETFEQASKRLAPIIATLHQQMEAVGRDTASLTKTIDVYSVTAPGFSPPEDRPDMITGSAEEIASYLRSFADLGFSEVRCDIWPHSNEAVTAAAPVVELVKQP